MRLFKVPNGANDRFTRAVFLSLPFDLQATSVVNPPCPYRPARSDQGFAFRKTPDQVPGYRMRADQADQLRRRTDECK
jgi:hypothetical protein